MLGIIFNGIMGLSVFFNILSAVPAITEHKLKAFPVMPVGQLHIGTWLMTAHCALLAQAPPWQGLSHLLRIHARSRGQSLLRTHSGRHPAYALPWNSGRHVQIPSSHRALEPQGDGLHLSSGIGSRAKISGKLFMQFLLSHYIRSM